MELTLRLTLALIKITSWFLAPIFWLISKRPKGKIPPISDQRLLLSAVELSRQIRSKKIKSETIVRAYISRIKEINPVLNAVVEERFIEAIAEAKAVDDYLNLNTIDEKALEISKPLLGVPLTVKESCSLKGMSFSVGSKLRLGMKASEDGVCTALLRKAGAIPLLVSNTPELCFFWDTDNLITGCTNNPYNTKYASAGSSGGEGALLASSSSLIGYGTDLCGSIRLPALFNGIFGHKGTANAVNIGGHFPDVTESEKMSYYFCMGPMTRYVEDLKLMYKVMIVDSVREKMSLDEPVNLSDLNIFYMYEATKSLALTPVSKEIKTAIDKSINHLQTLGCNIIKHKFKLENAMEIVFGLLFSNPDFPNIIRDKSDSILLESIKSIFGLSKYSKEMISVSTIRYFNGFVSKSKLSIYEKEFEELKKSFVNSLQNNGVFIFPTFPTAACRHNEFLTRVSGSLYLGLFNLLGFPCTHVPMGLNKEGLPIGFQVIGAPYQDRLCFAVARELEKKFGGWIPPN